MIGNLLCILHYSNFLSNLLCSMNGPLNESVAAQALGPCHMGMRVCRARALVWNPSVDHKEASNTKHALDNASSDTAS